MPKSKKSRPASSSATTVAKASQTATSNHKGQKAASASKQSRVIAMLQSPAGATIAAVMKATGWQPHSVRGFLAGVVRKRLKLKLESKKVDDSRVYQIANGAGRSSKPRQSKRKSRGVPAQRRAAARHGAGSRMERAHATGGRSGRWFCLEW
jgi:Protein of unknown function (DUF3489)